MSNKKTMHCPECGHDLGLFDFSPQAAEQAIAEGEPDEIINQAMHAVAFAQAAAKRAAAWLNKALDEGIGGGLVVDTEENRAYVARIEEAIEKLG